jgi:glycosyltransferase involved in cell wall biosynthesis
VVSEARGLRVALFGTFFPTSQFAGNSTTGIAACLCRSDRVGGLVLYCPKGSVFPPGLDWSKAELRPTWHHDSLLGLFRTLRAISRARASLDEVVFNIYVTSFGRSRLVNAVGLLLPSLTSILNRIEVVTFMHNFLETQEATKLGYNPRTIDRFAVALLERTLLRFTRVIVPLESQSIIIKRAFGISPKIIPLPYVELIAPILGSDWTALTQSDRENPSSLRVLLFGNWGPQKDLEGALEAVKLAQQRTPGLPIEVTVAGAINRQFPEYGMQYDRLVSLFQSVSVRFIGEIDELSVPRLLFGSDVLILPYRASGGYSGAMNCAALLGRRVIAYDLPQLREQADSLGIRPVWVNPDDTEALSTVIMRLASDPAASPLPSRDEVFESVNLAVQRVGQLVGVPARSSLSASANLLSRKSGN